MKLSLKYSRREVYLGGFYPPIWFGFSYYDNYGDFAVFHIIPINWFVKIYRHLKLSVYEDFDMQIRMANKKKVG